MTTLKIDQLISDELLMQTLGQRMAQHRIDLSLTQARLAEQAGVSKRTVERLEAGGSVQWVTVIRILRVLGLLEGLDQLVPEAVASPMELLKNQGKRRQRASPKQSDVPEASKAWSWDEES